MLRPNVIVYLDAPTDVVQSKIRERYRYITDWVDRYGSIKILDRYMYFNR